MTTTRVRCGWLVAWDGRYQRWIPGGELVVRTDRVVHAGGPWSGTTDVEVDARDALVAPGFVDAHVHAGALAAGRAYDDYARPDGDALGFLQYAAPSESRTAPPVGDAGPAARRTAAELLAAGVTTAVEFGGETGVPAEAMRDAGADVGVRLVLGRGFRSRDYVTRADGTVGYRPRGDDGREAFRDAVAFAEEVRELDDPWLGAMLFPLQVDTCSRTLLRDAYVAAEELDVPLQVHGGQTRFELASLAREEGIGPVARLAACDALGPRTLLAHGLLLSHHPAAGHDAPDGGDLDRLAASGAGIVHCPVAMARRGLALRSYAGYRTHGIDVLIGTDTYPRDVTAELRWAMYLSRIVDGTSSAPTSWDVLESATSLAADRIGRPDLGRLAPGMRADLQIVDLTAARFGPIVDPVAAWLHGGVAESTREVWVGGERRWSSAADGARRRGGDTADGPRGMPLEPLAGSEGQLRRWDGDGRAAEP